MLRFDALFRSSIRCQAAWFLLLAAGPCSGAQPPDRQQAEPLPPGVEQGWWARVQENIRESEYHITRRDGRLQAPNRGQGLRTWFDGRGALAAPRAHTSPDSADWLWGLELVRVGWKGGRLSPVAATEPQARENTVTYQRGESLREWYVNSARGLKSWYRVERAPEGSGDTLRLELGLRGNTRAAMDAGGEAVEFFSPGGVRVIRYGGLKAWDASGRELECRLGVEEGQESGTRVVLDIAAAGAAFPLTIDPLAESAVWTREGDKLNAQFGFSVASAGDVNGDGYSDVIVGADQYENGENGTGRVFVYHGSPEGLETVPAWTAESDQEFSGFGYSVASAGDVNGDGYSDVIVGSPWFDNPQSSEGKAYLYLGSPGGLMESPVWAVEGNQTNAGLGVCVASAGDINGDGYSDVIIGAYRASNGQSSEGRAYVYLGTPSGLAASPTWTGESNQANAWYGWRVASAGDVNGDGYSDVIVGAYRYSNGQEAEGRAYVYLGSPTGLVSGSPWTAESNQVDANFGYSVASAGDVNGDGYSDVIVGAYFYSNDQSVEGKAYLYLGSASGLQTSPVWTGEGNQENAFFGVSLASAGDVNGDGYSDVIVGAFGYTDGEDLEGRAYLYLGSASGLAASPSWTAEGNQADAWFGHCVASAGDVNGDGYSDVIVGAYRYDNANINAGKAFVYLGSPSGLAESDVWTGEIDVASAHFGTCVASAGDVNGDGYSDIIVGSPFYENGQLAEGRADVYLGSASGLAVTPAWTVESNTSFHNFGGVVASAGDVNGDGYSDVIVGAPNGGQAYVYLGSASGLAVSHVWTSTGGQANSFFGTSVASAGDVNGDGYSDIIVGAPRYNNTKTDEGRAFVYLGSASGLAPTPAWTVDGGQADARLGQSVASAGDVNGDGYSDVIVGASRYDNGHTNEGRAYVYLGSASGLAPTPAWTAESDQNDAEFGWSVASAGDVNGDGYSDVIVGAYQFHNGQSDEGKAYVYLGSASGLAATPAWTVEGNKGLAYFGHSVASAGDINGDGCSDVIVGANLYSNGEMSEGRAFVYLGSPSGLATEPAWTGESNQQFSHFGESVASAGDVNGDGYSDVVIGCSSYSNGQTSEGRAFVYLGNSEAGRGLSLAPRQRRGDNSAPLAVGGLTSDETGIRLAALGRTPYGRGKVKLQWEIKPAHEAFDGTGLGQSASWMDTGTAGAAINELISGQAPSTPYRWRMRLLYKKTTAFPQQASRWLTLPSLATGTTSFRTSPPVPVRLSGFMAE